MAESTKLQSVSFFCPAHNEEDNLPLLIPRAHDFFSQIADKFEILIIENGSTDKTPRIADQLASKYPSVRVLHYSKGLGYGGALKEGFRHSKFEYVCYTDADNQYDVREFSAGLALLNNADVVSGYVRKKAVSPGRRIQSWIWNILVRALFFVSIRDINCSMKVFKRSVLDSMSIESASAFIDAEMLINAKRKGFRIMQFPVTHFERTSGTAIGSSRSVIWATVRDAFRFWYLSYKWQIWIFGVAIAVRALYSSIVMVYAGERGFIAFSDAEYFYYRLGINLLEHHAFSLAQNAPWYPNAYHTPLYPLFLAWAFALKLNLFAIALIQAVIGALSAVFAFNISMLVSKNRIIAFFSGILCACEPMSIYWSALLMSDTVFSFIALTSLYQLLREKYLSSALLLGFAALTRPIALLFLPAFACFAAYQYFRKTSEMRSSLKVAALIFVAFAVVVSPWFVRNKIVYGVWEYTSAGWYDMYITPVTQFANAHNIPLSRVEAVDMEKQGEFRRFDFAYSGEFRKAIFAAVSHEPFGYVIFQIQRAASSLVSSRYEYLINVVVGAYVSNSVIAPLLKFIVSAGEVFWMGVLILVVCALRNREIVPIWLFTAYLIGVNAAISGGINPGGTDMSRYELPFQVLLFTLALIAARDLFKWYATRNLLKPASAAEQYPKGRP